MSWLAVGLVEQIGTSGSGGIFNRQNSGWRGGLACGQYFYGKDKIAERSVQNADCRLQTADCRPGTKCRLGTNCRLQTGYKMQTDIWNCFFRGFFNIISFYNLPVVTQSLFRCHIPRKLALPGNDLPPLLEIYFLNEVSKINSFLNMI